jgi:hypothetical protein
MMRRQLALVVIVAACGGHRHGPSTNTDPNSLFVEIYTRGSHDDALHDGAAAGLGKVSFARTVGGGGEIELEAEVSRLDTHGRQTACSVKILIVRLPQHDLLGIADASAVATGTDHKAEAGCIEHATRNLVQGKVRTLLRKRLQAKH